LARKPQTQAQKRAAEAEAVEAAQDQETAEAVVAAVAASQRRGRWLSVPQENVIAACALILSLVVATINVYYAMRGPVVVVQPLDQVLIFRDAEAEDETGDAAVLTVAIPLMMINAASAEHGDVMTEATLRLTQDGGRYPYYSMVLPIFTQDAPAAREKCEVGTRCLVFADLVLVERTDEIVDIPGGSAKSRYLSFPLVPFDCRGPRAACARYPNFREAVKTLEGRPVSLNVQLDFHSDGRRVITCDMAKLDLSYLKAHGWTAMRCESSKVTGDRWF
jgi:hypothetical protein